MAENSKIAWTDHKDRSFANGALANNPNWVLRGGRPMTSLTAKLQSVARPKKHIPTEPKDNGDK